MVDTLDGQLPTLQVIDLGKHHKTWDWEINPKDIEFIDQIGAGAYV